MIVLEELDPDALRREARHRRLRMERSVGVLDNQLLNVSGWLTASLFAINAGGAIAALGASDKLDNPILPISLFGFGLIFAMMNAYIIQILITLQQGPVDELVTVLQQAEDYGSIAAIDFDTPRGRLLSIQKWTWIAPLFGWASGIVFLIGGGALVIDQATVSPEEKAICHRLQSRMFHDDETATRSREIFKVIGCRFA